MEASGLNGAASTGTKVTSTSGGHPQASQNVPASEDKSSSPHKDSFLAHDDTTLPGLLAGTTDLNGEVNERPKPAGSMHSTQLNQLNEEVQNVLDRYAVATPISGFDNVATWSGLLSRPVSSIETGDIPAFAYGKFQAPQVNYTGARKHRARAQSPTRVDVPARLDVINIPDLSHDDGKGRLVTRLDESTDQELSCERSEFTGLSTALSEAKAGSANKQDLNRYNHLPSDGVSDRLVADAQPMATMLNADDNDVHNDAKTSFSEHLPQSTSLPDRPNAQHQLNFVEGTTSQQDSLSAGIAKSSSAIVAAKDPSPDRWQQAQSSQAPHSCRTQQVWSPRGLSTVASGQSPTARVDLQNTAEKSAEHKNLHSIMKHPRPSKVSKNKRKQPQRSVPTPESQSKQEINDFIRILQWKVHDNEQKAHARFAAERDSLHAQFMETEEAKEVLQSELTKVHVKNRSLTAIIDTQNSRFSDYATRTKRLKKFVDGLGNDITALKKDADVFHGQSEELKRLRSLASALQGHSEKSTQLRNEVVGPYKEALSQLELVTAEKRYLGEQLSEKAGLLAEERDRRAQLEQQLAVSTNTHAEEQASLLALKNTSRELLKRMTHVQSKLDQGPGGTADTETLSAVVKIVRQLRKNSLDAVVDVAMIKESLKTLDSSLTSLAEQSNEAQRSQQTTALAFHHDVNEAVQRLKDNISQREEITMQTAAQREIIKSLEDRLTASATQNVTIQTEMTTVRDKANKSGEHNASLQATNAVLQSKLASMEATSLQLNEMREELRTKVEALDSAKSELVKVKHEVEKFNADNSRLRAEIEMLQCDSSTVSRSEGNNMQDRAQLERKAQEDLERARKEMADHAEKFKVELRAQMANETKKLAGESKRLKRQTEILTEELFTSQAQVSKLKQGTSTKEVLEAKDLERLKEVTSTQEEELNSLNSSISELRSAAENHALLQKQHAALTTSFEDNQSQLEALKKAHDTVSSKVLHAERAAAAAMLAETNAKAEHDSYRSSREHAIEELEQKVRRAEQEAERATSGLAHFKTTCTDAMDQASNMSQRQIEALHKRLTEAQAELQKKHDEDEKFRAQVEQSWKDEHRVFNDQLNELKRRAEQAESLRDGAVHDLERLREEYAEQMSEQQAAFKQQGEQLRQSADSNEQATRVAKISIEELSSQFGPSRSLSHRSTDATPSAESAIKEPIRPRKKVDRNSSTTLGVDPISTIHDALRPHSRNIDSITSISKPNVSGTEGQQLRSDPFCTLSVKTNLAASHPVIPETLYDSDDVLSSYDSELAGLAQTVPETQSNPNTQHSYTPGRSSVHDRAREARRSSNTRQRLTSGFTIYEDARDKPKLQSPSGCRAEGQHSKDRPWSRAEVEKYTFKKSFPRPNSSSKRISATDYSIGGHECDGVGSDGPAVEALANVSGIAVFRRESQDPFAEAISPINEDSDIANHCRSPNFIHNSQLQQTEVSGHRQRRGSGAVHLLESLKAQPATDPRLVHERSHTPSKRKAETYIAEGYEHERKRRLNVGRIQTTGKLRRLTGSARTKDSGVGPGASQVSRTSSIGRGNTITPAKASQVRTLAGGSAHATRSRKKKSKNDEFDARFSQELGGRR